MFFDSFIPYFFDLVLPFFQSMVCTLKVKSNNVCKVRLPLFSVCVYNKQARSNFGYIMEDNNRRYAMYLDQQFRSRNLARGNNIKVISCQIDVSRNYIVLFSVSWS